MQKYSPVFEKALFYITLFLLAFIPLYPKFPLLNVTGTYVAVRFEDIIIAMAFVILAIYLYLSGLWRKAYKDTIVQALFLFFLITFISLFSGTFLNQTVDFKLGLFHYLRRPEFMLLLLMSYYAIKTKKQLMISLIVLSIVVFLVNIYALGQEYFHFPVISTTNSEYSKGLILYLAPDARVNSTFAGHYDLAVFLVMVITMMTAMFFKIKNLLFRGWVIILGGLSFFILVLTAARLSFVAVIIGVIASLLLTGKKIFILILFAVIIGAFIYPSQLRDRFISTLTINVLNEGTRYNEVNTNLDTKTKINIPTLYMSTSTVSAGRIAEATLSGYASDIAPEEPIDNTELGVYRSFKIRFDVEWPRAIRAFTKNPFFGTGFSSIGIATDNDYLRMLGETGLLGTLSFALVILVILKRLWLNYKKYDYLIKYFSAGVFAICIAFLVNGLFIDVFEASKIASLFWIIIGIGLAVKNFE